MATAVIMKNEATGKLKTAYVGFSWTTLLFGSLPALFRGDFYGFVAIFGVTTIIQYMTSGHAPGSDADVAVLVLILLPLRIFFSAVYNGWHLTRLKESGFEPQV